MFNGIYMDVISTCNKYTYRIYIYIYIYRWMLHGFHMDYRWVIDEKGIRECKPANVGSWDPPERMDFLLSTSDAKFKATHEFSAAKHGPLN